MTRILGVDPGITTGYALYDTETNKYNFWQLPSLQHLNTWRFLTDLNPDEIVYEDFKHRPQMVKSELHSVEVIAILKLYGATRGGIIMDKFLPAEAKAFWTDEKIRKLGLWEPGQRHAMDALKALLTYLGKKSAAWFREMIDLLKPPA